MTYEGELFGKVGRKVFPTGKTGKDWDNLEKEKDSYRAKAEGLYKLIQEALHVDVYVEEEARKIMEGVI